MSASTRGRTRARSELAPCMTLRVCVSGCSGAGKSSLITRMVADVFVPDPPVTIGIDHKSKGVVTSDGLHATIAFSDLAGQERFYSVCSTQYRNADVVLVVFDPPTGITGRKEGVPYWIDMAKRYARENVPILLVANKTDTAPATAAERAKSRAMHGVDDDIEERAYSGRVFYVSAKTGAGTGAVVQALCDIIESTTRYHDAATDDAVARAQTRAWYRADGSADANDDCHHTATMPGALVALVEAADGTARVRKAPLFVTTVGGNPSKEFGSDPTVKSSVSRLYTVKSRRVSGSGGCAC